MKTDVTIIGAGAVGSALARELSRFRLNVVLLDKNEDLGGGASRANSAIVHTGFDAPPGSLESRMVTEANPLFDKLTRDLDVPFTRTGAVLTAVTPEEKAQLPSLLDKAFENNVCDVELLNPQEVLSLEPRITPNTLGGIFIPRESIVDPLLLVVAYTENAVENGVKVMTDTKVIDIRTKDGRIKKIVTTKGTWETDFVVNAAGLFGDKVAAMAGEADFTVHPRKGQFLVLDKAIPYRPKRIILPTPTKITKGKLATPTTHGNTLVGPTAEDGTDKEDLSVTVQGLREVINGAKKLFPDINEKDAITQYSGLRPVRTPDGFHLEASEKTKGYIGLTGIRSTGISASPRIALYALELLEKEGLPLEEKPDFNPVRRGVCSMKDSSPEEQKALIDADPSYGRILCRCETVTEGEIREALKRTPEPRTLDALKRRLRVGAGRCQGGFCSPRVIELLARELNIPPETVYKNDKDSKVIYGKNR